MKRVILESPYSPANGFTVEQNIAYAKLCMRDCLQREEAPLASHLLWTQPGLLDDTKPEERVLGMQAGFEWTPLAQLIAVYTDLGISSGMRLGIERANLFKIPIEYRTLPNYDSHTGSISDRQTKKLQAKDGFYLNQIWRQRNGNVGKIFAVNEPNPDYTFYTLYIYRDHAGNAQAFNITVGPDGLYLPQLGGTRTHDYDLVELLDEKDFPIPRIEALDAVI